MIFYGTMYAGTIIFFFFFQAEDGIRDPLVTGVQTCALPISRQPASSPRPPTTSTTRSTTGHDQAGTPGMSASSPADGPSLNRCANATTTAPTTTGIRARPHQEGAPSPPHRGRNPDRPSMITVTTTAARAGPISPGKWLA